MSTLAASQAVVVGVGGVAVFARACRPLPPPPRQPRRSLTRALAMSPSSSPSSSSTSALDQLSASSLQLPATVRRESGDSDASTSSTSSASSTPDAADLAPEGRALWQRERARVLSGCEPLELTGKRLRVALLMSGGVDSAVALLLLVRAGHEVWPFYLKIWFEEDFRNSWSSCPWEEDIAAARAVLDSVVVGAAAAPPGAEGDGGGGGGGGGRRPAPLTLVPLTEHYGAASSMPPCPT